MKNTAPWLLVVAVLAVLGVRPGAKPAEKSEKKTEQAPVAAEEPRPARDGAAPALPAAGPAPGPPAWCKPAELIAEHAGTALDCGRSGALAALAGQIPRIDFYVALVPDPVDTPLPALFDQAINGLQKGFAQSRYLFDRYWLPWLEDEAREDLRYREAPGILLFRGESSLAVVLVVGETPKAGLHRQAMTAALALIDEMGREGEWPRVGVFGPTFSGTAPSLRKALAERPGWTFRIATGSATAAGLEDALTGDGWEFCRTVLPDDALLRRAAGFLTGSMGWNLRRAALLHEADTAYGMTLGNPDDPEVTFLSFPSHLSELRNVRTNEKPSAEQAALDSLWRPRRPVTDLNLIDREQTAPVDRVQAFSSLTPVADDLVLSNILETISREEFRYVGIVATDPKDKLFLAGEVRRYAPGTVLFSLDNSLLYAHPKLGDATDGMIVISSYPLFTEGAPWLPSATSSEGPGVRRQYASDFEQGLVASVRYLLGEPSVGEPTVWVGVVSNGSVWPLARLPVEPGASAPFTFCGTGGETPADQGERSWASKVNLQLLVFALLVVILARWLKKAALIDDIEGVSPRLIANNRRLLVCGLVVLALAAAILLILATIPILWATDYFTRDTSLSNFDVWRWALFMAGFFAVFSWLVRTTVRVAPGKRDRDTPGEWALWIAVSIGAHLLVALALFRFWVPAGKDGLAYAYLRVLAFSSGLSPLISLGFLVGGSYAWLLNEMKRRLLVARQAVRCPLAELGEPALAGADRIVAEIALWTDTTLPSKGWMLWLLPAVVFLPPALLLSTSIQPIAESPWYGRYFLCVLIGTAALCALSFFRFCALWHETRRLLVRFDVASPELRKAFARLGAELEWKPMKSFAVRIPPFRGLMTSVRKLEALARRVKVEVEEEPEAFDRPLADIMESAGREALDSEIAARNRLERKLDLAVAALAPVAKLPEVREALALRVATYLRYVFSHMRSALLGAMTSGLLALVAVHFYQFQPKQFISLALWLLFSLAVLAVLWAFVSMDRNPTLSRLGDTKPGAVTLDTAFVSNLLTYGALPLLGLVGTQVSAVGNLVRPILDQVLRVLGGG